MASGGGGGGDEEGEEEQCSVCRKRAAVYVCAGCDGTRICTHACADVHRRSCSLVVAATAVALQTSAFPSFGKSLRYRKSPDVPLFLDLKAKFERGDAHISSRKATIFPDSTQAPQDLVTAMDTVYRAYGTVYQYTPLPTRKRLAGARLEERGESLPLLRGPDGTVVESPALVFGLIQDLLEQAWRDAFSHRHATSESGLSPEDAVSTVAIARRVAEDAIIVSGVIMAKIIADPTIAINDERYTERMKVAYAVCVIAHHVVAAAYNTAAMAATAFPRLEKYDRYIGAVEHTARMSKDDGKKAFSLFVTNSWHMMVLALYMPKTGRAKKQESQTLQSLLSSFSRFESAARDIVR